MGNDTAAPSVGLLDLRDIELPGSYFPALELAPGQPPVDLVRVADSVLTAVVAPLRSAGLIKDTPEVGLAMTPLLTHAEHGLIEQIWDDPVQLIEGAVTIGENGVRYAWNAARKLRMMCRELADSSLAVVTFQDGGVQDPVDSQEDDGSLRWGDFPHPGAVLIEDDKYIFGLAISSFSGRQDHALSSLTGTLILEQIALAEGRK